MRLFLPFIVIGFAIAIISCRNDEKTLKQLSANPIDSFPIVIDTFNYETSKRIETWLTIADFEPLYIGSFKDTIFVDYRLKSAFGPRFTPPGVKDTDHQNFSKNLKVGELSRIQIKVNPKQLIKNDNIHVNWDFPFFEAYPVLLVNKEPDTVLISIGPSLPLITEAKDSLNNWRPIENKLVSIHGFGDKPFFLPPNSVILTSTMVYHGDYETELRVKLGKNVSNSFKGRINYRQFESMFDSLGNYKEAYQRENIVK